MRHEDTLQHSEVTVQAGDVRLEGQLTLPREAEALVLFAHGSGSSRHSPRNRFVAEALHEARLATLLFDLLTPEEETVDMRTRELRFDLELLADRLTGAIEWALGQPPTRHLQIGIFGASTGAAAALMAAARQPEVVGAVVSRGGRPDLAGAALSVVRAPTLLIVGGNDPVVLELNRQASELMQTERRLEIIPGASHLFEEPGTLENAAALACAWFTQHLTRR
jgi:putative phosphoribosyl transferase